MLFGGSRTLVAAMAFCAVYALPTDNTALIAQLKTDATVIKRFQRLLSDGGNQVLTGTDLAKASIYDFQKGIYPIGGPSNGGTVGTADRESFPILLEMNIAMNYVTLGPCGIFLPHVHPRANEFFVVVEGEIDFGYMLESGLVGTKLQPSPEIKGKLTKFTGTLFPQGSVHYQINNNSDCTNMTALATLSSDDPGAVGIIQMPAAPGRNATVRPRAEEATAQDMEDYRPILPADLVAIYDKCLARCFPKA